MSRFCCRAIQSPAIELGEQRLVEAARRLHVDILDDGILPEAGELQSANEPLVLRRQIETGASVDCFPIPHGPSPLFRRVGIRNFTFEMLGLHTRYGPHARSTAQGGLCHGASTRPVARTNRLPATRSIDNSLGGIYLHWRSAPSGRTE